MCQGSRYMKDARKYMPNTAPSAIRIIPGLLVAKNDLRNAEPPSRKSILVSPLPGWKALTMR